MSTQVAMRDAFGESLLAMALRCPEMVVLDADVATSTRTAAFGRAFPDRFFNVGVAEANMIDIAAGLATCGLRPIVSTFAIFISLKGLDQVRNTLCYNKLPVVLAGCYGGLSDSYDGGSHQAILDLAILRAMPNMVVVVPGDAVEVSQALAAALLRQGPTYIRICRNPTPVLFEGEETLQIGKIRKIRDGNDLTLAVCGIATSMAMEAAERLARSNVAVDLLEISTLKPIDRETLIQSARKTGKVLTVEEHTVFGGLRGAVAEVLSEEFPVAIASIGIQDCFGESGEYGALLRKHNLSADQIEARAKAIVVN